MTVTANARPSSPKTWVMPSFFPISPPIESHLDLDVHTGRKIELHQRIDRLGLGVEDVDQPFMSLHLELLARLLVDVRRAKHREQLPSRRERNRTRDDRPRLLRGAYDVLGRLIDHRVIERLEPNSNPVGHRSRPPGSREWS